MNYANYFEELWHFTLKNCGVLLGSFAIDVHFLIFSVSPENYAKVPIVPKQKLNNNIKNTKIAQCHRA